MSVTSFRETVRNLLQPALNIKFVDGYLDPSPGGFTDRSLGCTYPLRIEPLIGTLMEYVWCGVRVYLLNPVYNEPVRPHDPTALETAADTIQNTLGGSNELASPNRPFILLLAALDFDMDRYGIEAEVRGEQFSPAL